MVGLLPLYRTKPHPTSPHIDLQTKRLENLANDEPVGVKVQGSPVGLRTDSAAALKPGHNMLSRYARSESSIISFQGKPLAFFEPLWFSGEGRLLPILL